MQTLAEAVPGGGGSRHSPCAARTSPGSGCREPGQAQWVGTRRAQVRSQGQADMTATGQKSYPFDIIVLKILHNLLETSFYS